LIQSIRSLVFQGFGNPIKEGAGNLPRHVRPILRAELREFLLLNNSEHSPHTEEEKKQRAEFVEQWLRELASPETHDRLVEELGQDPWEHSIEETAWEDRIRELAAHLLRHEEEFDQELAWLSSEEAKSSAEFGIQLGGLDESLKFLDRIVTDEVVQLHLEQRVVQRLLSRFSAQGFVQHDLSRACLAQSSDAVARVLLIGRLALYGPNAARLHEELVPITARWIDPAIRKGELAPYSREAEKLTQDLLAFYFLPTIMAIKRNSPHKVAVVILNIFFGVTLFGWIIALVLASKQPQPVVVVYNTPPSPR
jgi:hypothetical protein